jgi:4-hydroxy-3-polyprenylbenzoate decarboxylase
MELRAMEGHNRPFRLVVGISGASGTIYGIRLLEVLRTMNVETHLILTEAAKRVAELETDYSPEAIERLATRVHHDSDIAAPVASGSFLTDGMVVAPCSIKSLSAIANSFGSTLLTRAADVTLKERRRLVLVLRETPLHVGHLKLAQLAAENGATIFPPVPSFYHRPKSIDDIVDQTVGRILDHLGLTSDLCRRWEGPL